MNSVTYRSPLAKAMVKAASKGKVYAPDLLAHELGHASLHGDSPYLMPVRMAAPLVGSVANVVTKTPIGLAGHLVPLADEAYASAKAMKLLKDWDIDEEDRRAAAKRLGLGFSSYAVTPAVDAGMTIGGIASGSTPLIASAPLVSHIAGRIISPRIGDALDRIPIKGLSKKKARALAKETRPTTDVYFSDKPFPGRGGFVSRPLIKPDEKHLEQSRIRKELGAYIGREASGKMMRRGGVLVSPTD